MARVTPVLHDSVVYGANSAATTTSIPITAGTAQDLVVIVMSIDGTPGAFSGSLAAFQQDSRSVPGGSSAALFVGKRGDGMDGAMVLNWSASEKFCYTVHIFQGVDYFTAPSSATFGEQGWEADVLLSSGNSALPASTSIAHENPMTATVVCCDDTKATINSFPSSPTPQHYADQIEAGGGGGSGTKTVLGTRAAEWTTGAGTSWGSLGNNAIYGFAGASETAYYWIAVYGPDDAPVTEHWLLAGDAESLHEIADGYVLNDQGFMAIADEDVSFQAITTESGEPPPPPTSDVHTRLSDGDISTWVGNLDDRATLMQYVCATMSDKEGQGIELDSIDSLSASVYTKFVGDLYDNDTCTVYIQMFQSDGLTALTDRMTISDAAWLSGQPGQEARVSVVFTGVDPNPYNYDQHRLVLTWEYARTGGSDGYNLAVVELRIYGLFTPTVFIDLTAGNIESRNQIQSGEFEIAHVLTTTGLDAPTEIQENWFFQSLSLKIDPLYGHNEIQTVPQVGQTIPLDTTSLTAFNQIQNADIVVATELVTTGLVIDSDIQSRAVDAESNLTSWSLEARHTIDAASITGFIMYTMAFPFSSRGTVLSTEGLDSALEIQSGRTDILHSLVTLDLDLVAEIQSGEVTALLDLLSASLEHEGEIQSGAYSQEYDLLSGDTENATEIQSGAINKDLTFTADSLVSTGDIESGSAAPVIDLTTADLINDTEIQSAAVNKSLNFHTTDLIADSDIQSVFVFSPGTMAPAPMFTRSTIQSGRTETDHTLYTQNLSSTQLTEGGEVFIPFNNLFTTGIIGWNEIQSVVAGQVVDLSTQWLVGGSQVQEAAVTIWSILSTRDLSSLGEIQANRIWFPGDLFPLNLYGHNEIQSGAFEIVHALTAANSASTGAIQSGLCNTEQDFDAADVVGPTEIQRAQVPYELTATGVAVTPEVQSGIIDDMRDPYRHPISMVIGV